MTLMEFFGCTFISFGPPLGLFLFTIARDPLRVIVLITSSFFWLLSLLLSSIWWFAVVPLRDKLAFGLVFSVVFQELFRFLFYKLLRKADEGLQKVSQQGQEQHVTPKDISNKHIMAYAFLTLCIILLHTFWGVIFFNALDTKQYINLAITLLNQKSSSADSRYYLSSIIPAYLIMFAMGGLAFHVAGGSLGSLKAGLKWKRTARYAVD
ncbi:APH1-like protein [Mya arenaria]|uniref:APH1-like protein n=1 Tax=Mya arenaria TaxID=6604 RepID=A0ABY7DXT9_MYAAR|nr:APH1-like protein [Mya arenaria]